MSSDIEDQISKLVHVLRSEQFTADDLARLCQNREILADVRRILRGTHEVKLIEELKNGKLKSTARVSVVNETTFEINLDAPPRLPFCGAKIESRTGSGWVKVEKRTDGLFMSDRKVNLCLSECKKGQNVLRDYRSQEEFSVKRLLHPNIMDVLVENSFLIPEDWKADEQGNTKYVFFWAVIFRNNAGYLFVRFFFFSVSQWYQGFHRLDHGWDSGAYLALLAS